MNRKHRVRYEMFIRVVQFLQDNIGDFPAGIVAAQLAILIAVVERLQTLAGERSADYGEARFAFNDKGTARETLRALLVEIAETSHSMVYAFPGIDLKFRLPRNNSDAELLARARAFLIEATPLKNAFIDDFYMDKNFLIDLQTLIDEFEASLSTTGSAIDAHVEATAEIGEEIRKGMVAVRTMMGAVKNKYRSNIGKLTAWRSASHVEKVPIENPRPPRT